MRDGEYLITGATGFLGRRLLERLLARGATVHAVVRPGSQGRLQRILASLGDAAEQVVTHVGDLEQPRLGLGSASLERLRGRIGHVFHLAALYDMAASGEALERANVTGTRHTLALARELGAGRFHHVSSIAAAGLYQGEFREDMFEEAGDLSHPYFRTKHDAEAIVRAERALDWRVYRPGMIVGDSRTGKADRVDGPYHLFKPIQLIARMLPRWAPSPAIRGGAWNLVPVDFVADALDHIAHREGLETRCFHLTDPRVTSVGEVAHIFMRAAGGGGRKLVLGNGALGVALAAIVRPALAVPPVARAADRVLARLGLDRALLRFLGYPTTFDSSNAQAALAGSGIAVPRVDAYASALWRYWEANLDPERGGAGTGAVAGKVVMITGASSGIGRAVSYALARSGARLVLVGRDTVRLHETRTALRAEGAEAYAYACDLSDLEACDALVAHVQENHGGVDVLVNNAGRSIRRSVERSFDRFHDFERTMRLNYFGALRLTLGLLPAMARRGGGHVINVSSIAVQAQSPRFSAYVASKAALDAFSRSAAGELAARGIRFTTVNMPLVRTPMIAPTRLYRHAPTLSPEQAAALVLRAITERPERIVTRLGLLAELGHIVAPRTFRALMSAAFRIVDDSAAAAGPRPVESSRPATSLELATVEEAA